MITQRARVVAVADHAIWVEISQRSACAACKQAKGCSVAVLAAWLGKRRAPLRVMVAEPLYSGDEVLLGIAESALLKSALCMYCIPLFALLLGAGFGQYLFAGSELPAILLGCGAMSLALLGLRYYLNCSSDPGLQPKVLKTLPPTDDRVLCSVPE